ncbi:hypothetical protein ACHQM5_023937 [Ranunculus cassubicifolius]
MLSKFSFAKTKLKYLFEDPPDDSDPDAEKWWSEMSLGMTWLWKSMEPPIASTVQFLDTAKKIWTALEEMYSQKTNVSRIYEIFETMFSTKPGDKPLHEHYAFLRSLWDELLIYQPISVDVTAQQKQREDFQCAFYPV